MFFYFALLLTLCAFQELRFILYVFPILTLAAAVACERLWRSKMLRSIIRIGLVGALVASLLATTVFSIAAYYNYPGSAMLRRGTF